MMCCTFLLSHLPYLKTEDSAIALCDGSEVWYVGLLKAVVYRCESAVRAGLSF